MSSEILRVNNLEKSLRSNWGLAARPVLKSVSFSIKSGEIFGFLGKNGSGKTTTIKTVLGLIKKNGGEILFNDRPLNLPTDLIHFGYLPELPYFYDHLSVEETLSFFGSLSLTDQESALNAKVKETLKRVGLSERGKNKVKSLSKGLQQRLGLAQAVINKPSLLILDEPFSGLDPQGRAEFRDIFLELNQSGTTIFISSHILSDVQSLCHSVSILSDGVIKKSFSLTERAELFGESMTLTVRGEKVLLEEFNATAKNVTKRATPYGEEWQYLFSSKELAEKGLEKALSYQHSGRAEILEFKSEPRSLEEIFLEVTGTN